MLISQKEIRRLLPHTGAMCLLDGVIAWDIDSIVCISTSHRRQDNPLRSNGRLAMVHAIEYGAQSMAVHGGLLATAANQPPIPAYLAAVRNVRFHQEWLDDIETPLRIACRRLLGERGNAVYECHIEADTQSLLEARITIAAGMDISP